MRCVPIILLLIAVLTPVAAAAETGPETADEAIGEVEKELDGPWHTFTLGVSWMLIADFGTTIRVDVDAINRGTEIDLEDLFGLDGDQGLWKLDVAWRPARSHILSLSYFDIRRSGYRGIRRDLDIGDQEFTAGADVETSLNTRITKFNYWLNVFEDESWEVSVGLGVYWMNIAASFEGSLKTPDSNGDFSVEESVRVDFPPPLIGLRGAWALTNRLRLSTSAELLYVPIDDYEGWIFDFHLGLEWDILDFAGLRAGYNFFDMGLKADYSGFHGEIEYRFHALTVGAYLYF